MPLTPEQKEHVVGLLEMDDKLEAVRYLKETMGVSAEHALMLAEKLEEEVEVNPLRERLQALKARGNNPGGNVGQLVGSIFMIAGGIMLVVVAYITVSNYQFSKRAIPVPGKVIAYDTYESDNDNGGSTTMYTPTFQYQYHGQAYTHKSSSSSSNQEFEINEPVDILVDPNDPNEILVDTFWEKYLLPFVLGFMGAMFSGLGYMAYRVMGKR